MRVKSRLITADDELFQQLPIGQPRSLLEKYRPAQVLDGSAYSTSRHLDFLVYLTPVNQIACFNPYNCLGRCGLMRRFFPTGPAGAINRRC